MPDELWKRQRGKAQGPTNSNQTTSATTTYGSRYKSSNAAFHASWAGRLINVLQSFVLLGSGKGQAPGFFEACSPKRRTRGQRAQTMSDLIESPLIGRQLPRLGYALPEQNQKKKRKKMKIIITSPHDFRSIPSVKDGPSKLKL